MKKLVKTAKQQFEERLNELRLVERWEMCPTEIYYGCEMPNGIFVLLRDQDGEYKELQYGMRYIDLLMTESFLSVTTERFINGQVPIRPLFDWYASADHNDEPFNLLDIYMSELEESHYTFEDLYEEIPDMRIITAKEQWEEDSKDALILQESSDVTLKVLTTDEYVKFYRLDDAITCYTYPSLDKMRKDRMFICQIVDTLSESCEHDKISPFIKWSRSGGDFPLPISIIFNSDYQDYTCHVYEDKELPQEQSIEQMLELTQEQKDALKAFEEASDKLKRSGVMLVSYWDENEFYAINGGTQLKFDSIYDYKEGEYTDISNVLVKKHLCKFGWDLYWGVDCSFCAKKF